MNLICTNVSPCHANSGEDSAALVGPGLNAKPLAATDFSEDDRKRFWKQVDKNGPILGHNIGLGTCWLWTGSHNNKGYGTFLIPRRRYFYAHRCSYALTYGFTPMDLMACHHCDNPPCCNPSHIFLGTLQDNVKDAKDKGRFIDPEKTHCVNGHAYEPNNVSIQKKVSGGTQRVCIICRRSGWRASWHRRQRLAALDSARSSAETGRAG